MSRNTDEDLPSIDQLGTMHPDVYGYQLEREAVRALKESGWDVRWEYFLKEGEILDPQIPEGAMVAVVNLKALRIRNQYSRPSTSFDGYAWVYVKNGEIPPFPVEADVLRSNDHQGDDAVDLYVAERDYNQLGNPIVLKKIEAGEDSRSSSSDKAVAKSSRRGRPRKK